MNFMVLLSPRVCEAPWLRQKILDRIGSLVFVHLSYFLVAHPSK